MLTTAVVAAHTNRRFDLELREIAARLDTLSDEIRRRIIGVVRALADADHEWTFEALTEDDEITGDDLVLTLLARRQPLASDLRFVFAAAKIEADLHSIGRALDRLVEPVRLLQRYPRLSTYESLFHLGLALAAALDDALSGLCTRAPSKKHEPWGEAAARLRAEILLLTRERGAIVRSAMLSSLVEGLECIGGHVDHVASMVDLAIGWSRS